MQSRRPMLECVLRLDGRPGVAHRASGSDWYQRSRDRYLRWVVAPEAVVRAIDAAVFWCADELPEDAQLMVRFGGMATPASSVEDVYLRAHEYGIHHQVLVWWELPERYRVARVRPYDGAVAFGEGGHTLETGDWRPGLLRLIEQLERCAPWAIQGYARRTGAGELRGVPRWHSIPAADALIHDMAGVLLLPDPLAGVMTDADGWNARQVGWGRSLVCSAEEEVWFGPRAPCNTDEDDLLVVGEDVRAAFAPALLTRARAEALEVDDAPAPSAPELPPRRDLSDAHRRLRGAPRWDQHEVAPPERAPLPRAPARPLSVAPAVLREWRKRSDGSSKASISTLLHSRQPPDDVLRRLRSAIAAAFEAFEEGPEFPPGYEEPSLGTWAANLLPEGVFLTVGQKAERFEPMLEFIVERLSAEGVTGQLRRFDPPDVPPLPRPLDLIVCHLRIRGVAADRRTWVPNAEAKQRLLDSAVRWCLDAGVDPRLVLRSGDRPHLLPRAAFTSLVLPTDGRPAPMRWGQVQAIAPDRARTAVAAGGAIILIESGPTVIWNQWRRIIDDFAAFLRAHADDLTYAYVRRGSDPGSAEAGHREADWPERPDAAHSARSDTREETTVPDPFGLQLLSSGHADRLPSTVRWRRTPVATDRFLVEYVEPQRFFAHRLVPYGGRHRQPSPEFLEEARADFEPLLAREQRSRS